MRVLADAGRLVVAEDGPNVLVIDRGNGPSEITVFVLLVITLVFGMFGLVTLLMSVAGSMSTVSLPVSTALLGIGILAGFGMAYGARSLRRSRLTPLESLRPVAVFDRLRRTYVDADGQIVAPLDQVRIERRMQIGSSSQKLVAVTPTGERVLMRGNPFGASIGNIDDVLNAALWR
ncbi:hypothetical protein [Mycobacterium sp. 236(2023)]|uniref:hypothetical protein n=1 Tax=Mycobacterium sp. 236(2023) TaxID=3038163 RepID=UPI002414DE7F|nr:hypothetical protein [Mycobacterium sp. 236(2023)]MDG4669061.1 hypothetical protein [Mycobacterium sp. 236(2023)]